MLGQEVFHSCGIRGQ